MTRNRWKSQSSPDFESLPCVTSPEREAAAKDSIALRRSVSMLVMKERRPAFRTMEGWARCVLLEAGAIRECDEHGWMKDRADPHARERAIECARENPPVGISPEQAVRAIDDVLGSIGDTCPECPPGV